MNDIIVSVLSNGQVSLTTNKIGYNGENKARNIIIKLEKYIPDGTAVLEINQHNKKYFLSLDEQEQTFVLPIYESLLAYSEIEMQFRLIKDENVIIKSEIFKFEIDDSINAIQKTIPEEYTDWFLDVSNRLNNIEENAATKEEIADFIKKDVGDLTNYYDKTTIDSKVQTLETKDSETDTKIESVKSNLANNYYKKNEIDNKMTSAIKYKGEVENYSDLEALQDTAENGDCYNIKNASEFNKAGDNAVWNEEQQIWDVLSGVIDLSNYYNSTQVDEKIDEETRDLLQGLSRELKTPDESGFSAQTTVSAKNKSGATEMIMEIDNLDIETDVPTNGVLGVQKALEMDERIKTLETGGSSQDVIVMKSIDTPERTKLLEDMINSHISSHFVVIYFISSTLYSINYVKGETNEAIAVDKKINVLLNRAISYSYNFFGGYTQRTFKIDGSWVDGKFSISSITDEVTVEGGMALDVNNTREYTPTKEYHPATKKYVDDSVANAGGIKTYFLSNFTSTPTEEDKTKLDEIWETLKNDSDNETVTPMIIGGYYSGRRMYCSYYINGSQLFLNFANSLTGNGSPLSATIETLLFKYNYVTKKISTTNVNFNLSDSGTGSGTISQKISLVDKEYVDNAVAEAGGGKVYVITNKDTSEPSVTMIQEIIDLYDNGKPFTLYLKDGIHQLPAIGIEHSDQSYIFRFLYTPNMTDRSFTFNKGIAFYPITNYRLEFNTADSSLEYTSTREYAIDSASKLIAFDNTENWTPTADYGLVHKKYVDDAITTAITGALEGEY